MLNKATPTPSFSLVNMLVNLTWAIFGRSEFTAKRTLTIARRARCRLRGHRLRTLKEFGTVRVCLCLRCGRAY